MADTLTLPPVSTSTTPERSQRFYRPELDMLRFGAFFLVFLTHWLPMDRSSHLYVAFHLGGAFGVPIFFALSSYLITELLLREKKQTGHLNLKAFYIRRIVRIWPLYFAVLIGGFVFGHFFHPGVFPLKALAAYLLLTGNIYAIYHGALALNLSPLWSIGVEEQFYILWPWLAKTKKLLTWSVVVYLFSQVALLEVCTHKGNVLNIAWFNTFSHLQYFAIGSALSILLHGKALRLAPLVRAVMLAAGLMLFLCADYFFNANDPFGLPTSIAHTYPSFFLAGIGVVLIILSVLGIRVSAASPFVYLGKISYGLYVFHEIWIWIARWMVQDALHVSHVQSALTFPISLGGTILVAWLSYRYFETPFLKLKKRFEVVHSRPV